MARSPSQTPTWEYWIPGWGQILEARDLFTGNYSQGLEKRFGGSPNDSGSILNSAYSILGESRNQFLEDREHTEMREDTAYQRGVEDMRKAGLNPYTIGASPAASSASSVGADILTSKLQILGYLIDLKNLDAKNRKITNDAIGDVLSLFKAK